MGACARGGRRNRARPIGLGVAGAGSGHGTAPDRGRLGAGGSRHELVRWLFDIPIERRLWQSARSADPSTMPCKGDVVTSVVNGRRRAILFIKSGKTDQTGEGTVVPFEALGEDDEDICPVAMIFNWMDRDISHLCARPVHGR